MQLSRVLVEEDGNGRRQHLRPTHSGFVSQSAVKVLLLGHVPDCSDWCIYRWRSMRTYRRAGGEVQSRRRYSLKVFKGSQFPPQPNSESTTYQTPSRPSRPIPYQATIRHHRCGLRFGRLIQFQIAYCTTNSLPTRGVDILYCTVTKQPQIMSLTHCRSLHQNNLTLTNLD
jgi:hypothetical protein